MAHLRSKLSYANVMATVAVFVALGGTSYAAVLAANSVGNKQLKNNAVTSGKVKNGTLVKKDFKSSELSSLKGAKGDTGATGATGAAGAAGAPGAAGPPGPTAGGYAANNSSVSGLTTTASKIVALAANGTGAITPSFNGRILVTATGNVHSGNTSNNDAFCDIRLSVNGGAFTQIGATNSYGVSLPTTFDNIGTTVAAGADVTAGTSYDAAMFCNSFNGTVSVDRSQLTAVVVAR